MSADVESLLAQLYHPELKVIDPGLERVMAFLELFGSPQKKLPPVIHVAGTNGKGSLIANLQAIFEAAGYRVHRYISPHLVRFNERIVLGGREIDDAYLLDLLKRVLYTVGQQPVTFFEATTAAAFIAFSEQPADIVLLETGMGGRLDATNVIDKPLLTTITPVSLDHCNFLGNNLSSIAYEKAGILKSGVPCVVGRQEAESARTIFGIAEKLSAPLYRMGQEWSLQWQGNEAVYQSAMRSIAIDPALEGAHQFDNAATAVACMDHISGFEIVDSHIKAGISQTKWPGRLQRLTGTLTNMLPKDCELWLDGGHNPHGAHALKNWLDSRGDIPVFLICGMVQGKDTGEFLSILAPCITKLVAVTIPDEPLSQPAELVEMAARGVGLKATSADSLEKALQTVAQRAKTPSIVCICGSLYLAGKVLAANFEEAKK